VRRDEPQDSAARQVVNWLLSDGGQTLAEETGYVRVKKNLSRQQPPFDHYAAYNPSYWSFQGALKMRTHLRRLRIIHRHRRLNPKLKRRFRPLKSTPSTPAPPPDLTHLITILNPSNFDALYLNPITLSTSQRDVPGTLWQSTFKIEGLKDESIQDAINNDLTSLYEATGKRLIFHPTAAITYAHPSQAHRHTMFTLERLRSLQF